MSQFMRMAGRSLALLLAVLPGLVLADPPARVGRLSYIENGVNFAVDRSNQGEPATVNWPISSGAVLDTDRRGRAEIWVGSTAYRLAGNSRAEFAIVDDRQVTLQLNEGSLAVSILDSDQADDVTVHTPDGSVRFATPGRYRIDVLSDHSELTSQAGQATLDDRGRLTPVEAGQKASFFGGGRTRVEADYSQDAFDNWVADRENATMANTSRRQVSPYMTGYQDLDTYGDWRPVAEYGTVWYPRTVADDWAPYRYGRWAWVAPWGWTWIDQAPWGFAPFHYGRWVLIQGRWGWTPGHRATRPVYSPALVGWVGNPGWSVSFRAGSAPAVGWFPLAPREVYVPSYRHSSNYIRQINVTHVTDVNVIDRAARSGAHERFAHRETARAVTVIPANLMREGRSITPSEIRRTDRHDLGRAPVAAHAPNADWVAPASNAARPRVDERRDQPNGRGRRDADVPVRPMLDERSVQRPEQAPRPAVGMPMPSREAEAPVRRVETPPPTPRMSQDVPLQRREIREPAQAAPSMPTPAGEPRRDMREMSRTDRQGARDGSPPAFRPQEIPQPPATGGSRMPQATPLAPAPVTEPRPEVREPQRIERQGPRDAAPPSFRQPESPVVRSPVPQAPQASPVMPPQASEMRREIREPQRMERVAPRDLPSPVFRQQEAPQPPPAMRSPAPQAMPQAAPMPMPAPEMRREIREAPRMAPPPPQAVPQAMRAPEPARAAPPPPQQQESRNRGGDGPRRFERGDDRGERGPR
ncbi:MAG: hypothetical protein Q8S26_06325 [Azonexus sp.]|nr:hypothetical protein [Azonexus sp.]